MRRVWAARSWRGKRWSSNPDGVTPTTRHSRAAGNPNPVLSLPKGPRSPLILSLSKDQRTPPSFPRRRESKPPSPCYSDHLVRNAAKDEGPLDGRKASGQRAEEARKGSRRRRRYGGKPRNGRETGGLQRPACRRAVRPGSGVTGGKPCPARRERRTRP